MAQNLTIDPSTRDYVTVNGSPIPSDRIEEKAHIALNIRQGQYIYGSAEQGSLIYTLFNKKRDSSIEQRYAAYAQDAIQKQLIETGQATAAQVTNVEATRTGTSMKSQIIPAQATLSSQLGLVSV